MPKIQCKFCGNDIWRKPSYVKRFKNIFCERKCHTQYTRSQQQRVKCSACDIEILLKGNRRKNSKTGLYFCGNKCKNPYLARYRRWAQNPDHHRHRRPILLESSEYACQNCGYHNNEKMLDIHHHNGIHRDNNWENLRCVCVWCHISHHRGVIRLDLPALKIIPIQEYKDRFIKKPIKKIYKCGCGNIITKGAYRCRDCYVIKSRKVKDRPNSETLLVQISKLGYCGTGRYYGVSDNAVRKWLKRDRV